MQGVTSGNVLVSWATSHADPKYTAAPPKSRPVLEAYLLYDPSPAWWRQPPPASPPRVSRRRHYSRLTSAGTRRPTEVARTFDPAQLRDGCKATWYFLQTVVAEPPRRITAPFETLDVTNTRSLNGLYVQVDVLAILAPIVFISIKRRLPAEKTVMNSPKWRAAGTTPAGVSSVFLQAATERRAQKPSPELTR